MMNRGFFLAVAFLAGATPALAQSMFSVDRIDLGDFVDPDALMRDAYSCKPSDDYPGFTWCKRARSEQLASGPITKSNSVLFGADGAVAYVNRDVFPVYFDRADIANEIDRLSRKFRLSPRLHPIVRRPGSPPAAMASWGGLVFTPLEQDRRDLILQGQPARAGVLVAQTPTFSESARENLPIYRLSGNAGFAYVAGYDDRGQGSLRYFAMDPSRLKKNEPQAGARPDATRAAVAAAEVEKARAEAEKAKAEAEKAKAEAEKARAEADKLRAQVDIARAAAERPKAEDKPVPPKPDADSRGNPEEQERFVAAVFQGREMFAAAQTETAAGGARANRKSAICAALPSMSVHQWRGVIAMVSRNGDGKGVLVVRIAPDLGLKTWGGASYNDSDNTLLDPESSLFKKLGALKEGDRVLFSGSFIGSDVDCVKETNLAIARSMQQPEFAFRFADVARRE